ncbi:hypothetical protein LI951_08980 [Enterococcus sp. BWT-B8]|nr:hypothetical protein [Enterococcus sp. BWT-B8]MCB5956034.1 hypothetical protein [Enterococcus sp. CWB-B31]
MYDSGSDSKEVQEILEHIDIAITMNTYTHVSEKKLSTAIERHTQYMNF